MIKIPVHFAREKRNSKNEAHAIRCVQASVFFLRTQTDAIVSAACKKNNIKCFRNATDQENYKYGNKKMMRVGEEIQQFWFLYCTSSA